MPYTPFYSTWKDWPDVSTPMVAAAMQHIESGISGIQNGAGGEAMPSGDNITSGGQISLFQGFLSTSSPDTGVLPTAKISRYLSHDNTAGDFQASADENFSAMSVTTQGAQSATNGVQTIGLYAKGQNEGSQAPNGAVEPDAGGVLGVGVIAGGGTGNAYGGFFIGERLSSAPSGGLATGVTCSTINQTGATTWNGTTLTDACCRVGNNGPNLVGSGITVGVPAAQSPAGMDVGIGFLSGATSAAIRDDSTAVSSIILNGTHTGYGIDLNGGTFTSGGIRLKNSQNVVARNAAGSADVPLFEYNSSNRLQFSTGMQIADSANITLGSTSGTMLGTVATQKLSFFGVTPVVQPSTTGTTIGFTAGSGTAASSASTYTGNTGSSAYTVGDIVLALKQAGLMKA